MIEIKEKSKCCGCHACYNICPNKAIEMKKDEKGFYYPEVNKQKCTNCGLCEKVCPVLNVSKERESSNAYACFNKDKEVRKNSSSGGIFTLIATKIINKGGVVFGAKFNGKYNVEHGYVESIEDLEKFRGSKYVQSKIGDTYKKVKEFLNQDRYVLFSGTPCQIEGLYTYLQKDYDKLYTQDFICHGVPSERVWEKYKSYLEKKYNSKITKFQFRNKETGWATYSLKVKFENGQEYKMINPKDVYMQAFLRNVCLRDSCYDCSFKKMHKASDIMLGDFWGIQQVYPEFNDNKGMSLISVNSKKGEELFNIIKNNIEYKEVDLEEVSKYNPGINHSCKIDIHSKEFYENLDKLEFDKLVDKYTTHPSKAKIIVLRVKSLIKRILIRR